MADTTQEASAGRDAELTPQEHRRLLAEIAAEVRRGRASGALPVALDRELGEAFAAHAPAGVVGDDAEVLLRQVDEATGITPLVPTASGIPGGALAKRAIRKSIFWCLAWVAGQTTTFARAAARALHALDERVAALEGQGASAPADVLSRLADLPVEPKQVAAALVPALQLPSSGRVCVSRVGGGDLCAALADAGLDAYGLEPDADLSFAAAAQGLDVRPGAARDHLRRLPPASLAGVVLVHDVDVLPAGARTALLLAAVAATRPGGAVAVVTSDLEGWGSGRTSLAADLAAARPWAPTTWARLLEDAGLEATEPVAVPGASSHVVVGRRPTA